MSATVGSLRRLRHAAAALAAALSLAVATAAAAAADPLPSWNATESRKAIVAFVERVAREGGEGFVAPSERIAVFDNDGTLWAEQPVYFQLAFALDRVKALAPSHPEWRSNPALAAAAAGDAKGALAGGERAIAEIVMASHAGMTTDEFAREAGAWLRTARHPTTGRLYTEMIYQPMLELLEYLRAHGFKTYIVSGGGVEFLRTFSERAYGIPPEQVIGSTIVTKLAERDGVPVLLREPRIDFVDDKAGKPVGINRYIGRRPIAAFGNSDGDLEMLRWTTAGSGDRFALLVHHTDAEREWAYDRASHVGRLDTALDEARAKGWTVVDMKADWKPIYPASR